MKNPTLEEFSLARFNSLRKLITRYYEEMKPLFTENNWDASVVDKMASDSVEHIDRNIKEQVEYFAKDKIRLEFVLDYLLLYYYTRILNDLFTKDYWPLKAEFENEENELNYNSVLEFLQKRKHWVNAFLKPMRDVLLKRKVQSSYMFEYFSDKNKFDVNIESGARHFYSLFPLPEYRELKKPKWNEATFNANGSSTPLPIFDLMNQIEFEINEKLKEKVALPAQEVDVPKDSEGIGHSKKLLRKGKTLIEFADGAKWVNLDVVACSLEGAHLEHCGNNYRANENNLRIWSFRTPTDEPGFYVGRLTFIYNVDTKMIGEAKARNNQKPQSKYHPYIVELLLLPMVEGLEQGRHKTESDFAFSDLNDELLQKLVEEKPTLFAQSKVGRSVIISRNLIDTWRKSYKNVTGQEAPNLEALKFDK